MNPALPKNSFTIQTEAYQGPFELVLDLIEARKLLVNDLALANITEDFIQHVRGQTTFPIDEAADFIQIAATLLLIKSKSLIPDLALTEEETADIDDLKRRLEAYERVREAARELALGAVMATTSSAERGLIDPRLECFDEGSWRAHALAVDRSTASNESGRC